MLTGVESGAFHPKNQRQVTIMSAAENKELIRNMLAELGKGNAQAFLGAMADDVRFTVMGTTKYSGTYNGKQDVVNKLLGPLGAQLEGGISLTPDNFIAEGDFVAMQARGSAKAKKESHITITIARSSVSPMAKCTR
jgi:ketosteroid isomerase-like protein